MSVVSRSWPVRLFALVLAAACLLLAAAHARAADPAVFNVGAATASINPDTPQYVGGYGYQVGPLTKTHDDLEARAFVVDKGDKALAFVSVDLVGWFAAYDGANAPYGIDATRQKIADALKARGFDVGRESVIISSTHVHAAPTVVGIWGSIDPDYLKKVSEAAVTAATAAADQTKPSEIWTGIGSIRSIIWQNGQGTDHPDGFGVDSDLPILWARDPQTGATNALYVNVPDHPDQYQARDTNEMSADWPGYVRRKLDLQNGGTAVLAAGTLGRQETPGSITDYSEVTHQGEFIANQIQRTMAKATPLTDDTIAANEQYLQTTADNEDLLLAININPNESGICIDDFEKCTIPRSKQAPYFAPGDDADTKKIGTYVEAARIGDVAFATNPGEAFPEINWAIRDGVSGPRQVNVIAQSGDMLGYYYQRNDYTDQQFGSSDFEDYNVGPDLAQANADKAIAALGEIGFSTTPQTVHASGDTSIADKPGVQWYSDQQETANHTVTMFGSAAKSQDGTVPEPEEISWDFGDETTGTSAPGERFDHTFPGPGTYEVTATVTGTNSETRNWTDSITIDPPLSGTARLENRAWNGATVSASITGGQGDLVSARWTCQDGAKVDGLTATCTSTKAGTATVAVTDGAGNSAEASIEIGKAPAKPVAKLKIIKAKVKPRKVKRGKAAKVAVTVKNTGNAAATGAKLCLKVPGKAKKGVKARPACRKIGKLAAGKTRKAGFKLKTTRKAKAVVKPQVVFSAKGAKSARKTVKLRTRR
jgi:hypothetical protein